jgi:hypothetical protein
VPKREINELYTGRIRRRRTYVPPSNIRYASQLTPPSSLSSFVRSFVRSMACSTDLKLHPDLPTNPLPDTLPQLAPTLSKALVLSDDTLSFLSLPRLEPVPSDLMRSMKNVLQFAINETPQPMEPVGLAIAKRTGISFWELGNKAHFIRVSPYIPSPPPSYNTTCQSI